MDSSHLAILHDHYKESFAQIREREKQRDKLFLILIAILGLLFLGVQYPAHLQRCIKEISAQGTKIDLNALPIPIVTSAIWTALLSLILRYCQTCIIVERNYEYLHQLEDSISSILGHRSIFAREGRAYLTDYPAFLWWAWRFYSILFPCVVVGLEVYLLGLERSCEQSVVYNFIYDCIMALGVVVSLALYRGAQVWGCVIRCVKGKQASSS